MQVQVIDNVSRTMIGVLSEATTQSDDIRMAVAFVSRSALLAAKSYLNFGITSCANKRIVSGLVRSLRK